MSRYALTEEFERLLGISITERGPNVMLRCPFHPDGGAPNLSVQLETGYWMCFRDGEKGNIFTLASKLGEQIDQTDVILRTYQQASPPHVEPPDFTDKAEALHERALKEQPIEIVRYIVDRGMSPKVLRAFKLGWTGSAISQPYYDNERVVGIKYRAPDGFKWYETGSQRCLYNVDSVRGAATVILCEGESDTHSLWSELDKSWSPWHNARVAGVPGVGTGLPSRSTWELWTLELAWAKKVYIAFDADEAGDAGSSVPMAILGDRAERLRPPVGKDWTEAIMGGSGLASVV